MKIINNFFLVIILFNAYLYAFNISKENVLLFSDYNTDVVLFFDSSNSFRLLGYGGSANESADCIIQANGKLNGETLTGFLENVNTALVSYNIEKKEEFKFSATLKKSTLVITEANTFSNCGLGTNFIKKYMIIKNECDYQKKINGIIELLNGFKENENLITILKQRITSSATVTDKDKLTIVYNEALRLFKREDKKGAAAIALKFTNDNTITNTMINLETVNKYNDLGFFLEQGKKYREAVELLEKVVNTDPNRTVAYINLGDAYFGLKNSVKAKGAYLKYIDLMKKDGKSAKIPKRVFERVKSTTRSNYPVLQ
ncbi:MAG: tetratricopeptide repeat protein [Fibrobacter sp.]|nr:tetratricopeptide repeat protein [Fibrobacter sp.]